MEQHVDQVGHDGVLVGGAVGREERVEHAEQQPHHGHGLARKHGLSAYDALYLELALHKEADLATADRALAAAARAEGVRVVG